MKIKKLFFAQFILLAFIWPVFALTQDTLKPITYLVSINLSQLKTNKIIAGGIQVDHVKLYFEKSKKESEVEMEFPKTATVIASGLNTEIQKDEIVWNYNWNVDSTYKLMIATASDSAENFIVYSGYVFLPENNKWKLIGSCKINGHWGTIKSHSNFYTTKKMKDKNKASYPQQWLQRENNKWHNELNNYYNTPTISPLSSIDSLQQSMNEVQNIETLKTAGTLDVTAKEGIYYKILKPGTGAQVKLTDTVTVHYKGYTFGNNIIFDQTKTEPATFGLTRLIKGWQIGVPLLKVGGKIQLYIPSGQAYGIRTRAAKIPPNSVLVFEVEVLGLK